MSTPGFAAGQIEELLIDLATRAALDGRTGAIRVVGGWAIALMNTDRRATRDIDAVLAPADQLLDIAHDMARLRGLKPDWLNDAVKGFVPPVGAEDRVEIHRVGDVSVRVWDPRVTLRTLATPTCIARGPCPLAGPRSPRARARDRVRLIGLE